MLDGIAVRQWAVMCCNVASDGRDRIGWLELVAVGRFVQRLFGGEYSIRVQVIRNLHGAFERPLRLIAPVATNKNASLAGLMSIASAHDKDADWALTINPVVDTPKPLVEPTGSELVRIDTGRCTKLSLTSACVPCSAMPPRSDDQLLVVLRLAQRGPVQARAPQVGVEPAGEMVDGNVLLCVIVTVRHGLDEPVLR